MKKNAPGLNSCVHCKIPNAGLGNQLFAIVKAHYFGQLNNLPVLVSGYNRFKIGPYLRGEKSKRRYNKYFYFEKGWLTGWFEERKLNNYSSWPIVKEPTFDEIVHPDHSSVFEFSEVPHWSDYFKGLKDRREEIKTVLSSLVKEDIFNEVNQLSPPTIGVHIRMGDFRKLKKGENFGSSGAVRTPETYFIDMIRSIREINGSLLPVSVFTDGYRSELKDLLQMENVSLVEGNKDIVDMLLLSRSKVIVTSAGSTFSYWSAFLSDAPVIRHTEHLHEQIRPASVNELYYEGPLHKAQVNSLLFSNIQSIKY